MDAKPQRPRVLRVFDENAMPPPAVPGKTLHQRTKSVSALYTMQSAAAKAAAFAATKKVLGEVNTNLKMMQPAKDDSVIGKKVVNVDIIKPTAPLARPATRPSTAKSFSTLSAPTVVSVKEHDSLPIVQLQEPARKLVVKKSTKVLRDVDNVDNAMPVEQPAVTLESRENGVSLSAAPLSATLHSVTVDPSLSHDLALHNDPVAAQVEAQASATTASDPSRFQPEQPLLQHVESQVIHNNIVEPQVKPTLDNLAYATDVLPQVMPAPAPVQQYYDEDFEYYDDDGYTTARSFGLRGSLGGFTTVSMPKQTEESREEIRIAKMYIEDSRTVEEIDDEEWDTSMVAEYSEEIFEYMRKLEDRMRPNPRYMDQQQEIQWSMRAVLVDWVVQVHQRFNLLPETLFLCINYIDRFLTHKVVSLGKLQLVGATALFIAAKFEEVNCPTLQEIIFMVDGGYTMDELLKAERFMLSMLQFDLGWPGPMSFLRRISKADDYDLETRTLAKYFLEVTIMDERFIGCTPSFLAAGAHCMARLMLRKGDWSMSHVGYSEYTYAQLRHLLNGIYECCENPHKHHLSVYEKYTDKRYKRASTFVEGEMLKGFSLHPRALRMSLGNYTGEAIMPE
ncbi:hypothetical protein AMS68_000167 [Peltaster fructicola]|uniref:Uncharacterized protein n=1 Tax=Peltaster fructicola TaxID=286661 RepID=A0A6H0XJE8_9PEZI|nr:hypothetical protein AMS68_000167 [Peltaster fructicola]